MFDGNLNGIDFSLLINSTKLVAGHGVYPQIISYSISPKLQISVLLVYGLLLNIWGDIYNGVPTIESMGYSSS